jgi:endonuclease/exonuclease/phosphatase family metal-dependent hydrolase
VTPARSDRGRWRARPAAGLLAALLGLAALGAAVSAGPASAAGPVLRLATWNIEHLAAADGAGCRPRTEADYRELRAVAEALDADIIAVQEVQNAAALARVFDSGVYAHVVSARPEHGRDTCRGMPGQRRLAQRTGFAIHRGRLARQGLDYRVLPAFRALGDDGRRWGVRIQIEGADGPVLELMSIHLKSGCAYNRLDRDVRRHQCEILIRQRGILEEWIDARAAADTPFVVLGDFNRQLDQRNDHFWTDIDDGEVCDWRPDPTLGRRCKPGSTRRDADADLVLAGAGRPFPYAYNPRYPYAIDHIVLGGPAADWRVRGSWEVLGYQAKPKPSDHHPIAVLLKLP